MTNVITSNLTPLSNKVLVTDLELGEKKLASGIILTDDNGINRGIRSRWAKVFKIGSKVEDIVPGEWVLLEHGRWTNRIDLDEGNGKFSVWMIDYPNAVLLVSTDEPEQIKQLSKNK